MPEGHYTHRLAQDHRKEFAGQEIAISSPQGRFADDARAVDGRVLKTVRAFGKQVFYDFGGGDPDARYIHVHLGRYGKLRKQAVPAAEPVGQVRMRFLGEQAGFDLTGPTTCRVIGEAERETVLAKLGPDPLDPKADAGRAFEKIKKSSREVGGLILDQAVIAGIGNIYRAEILFELGLDPTRPGTSISREEFDAIWETTVRLMKVGVKYRKIITVSREEAGVPLSRIPGRERTRIYKKRHCLTCNDPIKCWEQANRKMYACPSCQGMS